VVDDKKVAEAGHHAIIPTGHVPSRLSDSEAEVFDLIARRLSSSLMPAGEDERTTIFTQASGQTFRTRGTAVVVEGWRVVVKGLAEGDKDSSHEDSGPIPAGLSQGESVRVQKADVLEKTTKAAARLNDASLLALMEKHSLGTPATRARMVEVLLLRGYAQRQKKNLITTKKGQSLLTVVPQAIQSPEMTGKWEAQLEAIASGNGSVADFMTGIRQYTQELVADAQGQASQAIGTDLGPCPSCKQGRIVAGKKGWGCSRWRDGCKFAIWKEVAGKKLSETQVKTLLVGKVTGEIKGFTSKAGKPFSAKLKLVDGRVQFVFDDKTKRGA
jgi:DNA topoisomerase-3